LRGEGFAAL
jgi:hypothetical protein